VTSFHKGSKIVAFCNRKASIRTEKSKQLLKLLCKSIPEKFDQDNVAQAYHNSVNVLHMQKLKATAHHRTLKLL